MTWQDLKRQGKILPGQWSKNVWQRLTRLDYSLWDQQVSKSIQSSLVQVRADRRRSTSKGTVSRQHYDDCTRIFRLRSSTTSSGRKATRFFLFKKRTSKAFLAYSLPIPKVKWKCLKHVLNPKGSRVNDYIVETCYAKWHLVSSCTDGGKNSNVHKLRIDVRYRNPLREKSKGRQRIS